MMRAHGLMVQIWIYFVNVHRHMKKMDMAGAYTQMYTVGDDSEPQSYRFSGVRIAVCKPWM